MVGTDPAVAVGSPKSQQNWEVQGQMPTPQSWAGFKLEVVSVGR